MIPPRSPQRTLGVLVTVLTLMALGALWVADRPPRDPSAALPGRPAPADYETMNGPVAVRWMPEIPAAKGAVVLGQWNPLTRTITLRQHLPPRVQQVVFGHERCHQQLDDTGVAAVLIPVQKEAVCDALAPLIAP